MSEPEEPTRRKRLGERQHAFDAYEDAWYRALKAKAEQRFGEPRAEEEQARPVDTRAADDPANETPPTDTPG